MSLAELWLSSSEFEGFSQRKFQVLLFFFYLAITSSEMFYI